MRIVSFLVFLCLFVPAQADTAVKIVLPPSLEGERSEIESQIEAGNVRLSRFAEKYGWQKHLQKSLYDEVVFYDEKSELDQALRDYVGAPDTYPIPESFSGGLLERKLVLASPDLYLKINPDAREARAFEKLVCCELSHELHSRLLGGDGSTGPRWFFEGFGLVASGQYQDSPQSLSEDDIWAILDSMEERSSARDHAQIMYYFLESASLPELVERASKSGFSDYLAKLRKR